MRKRFILAFLLFFTINLYCITLKKVLEIGTDKNEKYTFFSIGSITTDGDGNIYVFDSKGYVLRKYDKRGKFLKQTGRRGKGPGDFSFSSSLSFSNNKLYVFDKGNNRIAIYDKNINLLSYIESRNLPLLSSRGFFVYKDKIYVTSKRNKIGGKISIINLKGKIIKRFFNSYPSYLKAYINIKDDKKKFVLFLYSIPLFSLNKNRKEIAVMFLSPHSETKVFIYDIEGKLEKECKTYLLKEYKVPECLKNLSLSLCKSERYGIGTIAYLRNYLFISYFRFVKGRQRGIPYFAIYDIKNKKILENKKNLFYIIYHADKDKLYVSDEDNDKVIVFKVNE